jgi:hypothetical protein
MNRHMNRQPIVSSEAIEAAIAEGRQQQQAAIREAVKALAATLTGKARPASDAGVEAGCHAC